MDRTRRDTPSRSTARPVRTHRTKGWFGDFEMLKPCGTDCTTSQKTCVGVLEHLRSSSISKVDAHTTLCAVSEFQRPRATASSRRAPRTPEFNNASKPPHMPHTIARSSARTHPNHPRSCIGSIVLGRTSNRRATSNHGRTRSAPHVWPPPHV